MTLLPNINTFWPLYKVVHVYACLRLEMTFSLVFRLVLCLLFWTNEVSYFKIFNSESEYQEMMAKHLYFSAIFPAPTRELLCAVQKKCMNMLFCGQRKKQNTILKCDNNYGKESRLNYVPWTKVQVCDVIKWTRKHAK